MRLCLTEEKRRKKTLSLSLALWVQKEDRRDKSKSVDEKRDLCIRPHDVESQKTSPIKLRDLEYRVPK